MSRDMGALGNLMVSLDTKSMMSKARPPFSVAHYNFLNWQLFLHGAGRVLAVSFSRSFDEILFQIVKLIVFRV